MLQRVFASLVLAVCTLAAAVPTPKEHLGFTPGDDYKLADFAQVSTYFQKLAASTDRMKLVEFGKSSMGKPMLLAIISSAENLQRLEHYKEINRKLALGLANPAEATKLSQEGKAIVWIDSGLHATEVAPVQHSPELAYRMITGEDEETRRIRDRVILLQVPVINPDGLDMVAHWYAKNVGTPYEHAPLPSLYQKYAGHDNNRDYFMLNLQETRNVTRLLFQEWFPQIVYNQHQAPAFPARIFVPPYAEPLNPNIPPPVMEGINLIGAAIKERFARESKPGILSYHQFDAWWNGGLRSVPAFHNMHGILTETALYSFATPKTYKLDELPERFPHGIPTKEPTVFYERPWLGGKWGVREAIDYMLTADFAILDMAASRSDAFLRKAWEMATTNIDAGQKLRPYAYLVPADQWDKSAMLTMLDRLAAAGVQVKRARGPFTANGKTYEAGTYVMLAGQPFRGYLVDLMEPQKYPELRSGTTGPTKRPYDVAGWTLRMQMGVNVDRAEDMFRADLEDVAAVPAVTPVLDRKDNSSYIATADLLAKGAPVRWAADGRILTSGSAGFEKAAWELRKPRLAIYEPYAPNMDAGWTQFVLDSHRVPYTAIRNEDFRKPDLRAQFDCIILASQAMNAILHGIREGERPAATGRTGRDADTRQRPEYTGGISLAGLGALEQFVRNGGTLIAFDAATDLPVNMFPLPVRPLVRESSGEGTTGYYSPGSILRVKVDTHHPIAFGMPEDAFAFTSGGQAWDIALMSDFNKGEREVRPVVRYADRDLLASGWISGERTVLGKSAVIEARHGKGRVVLFGFRPQFRGQTHGTFKLLLNAIYLASAKEL